MIKPGDLVGDPFGGVALGGIACAYSGLRWLGVELEPRFVELGNRNIELHRRELEILKCPMPVLTQGDSRNFAALVREASGIVTSPPFLFTEGGSKPPVAGWNESVGCHEDANARHGGAQKGGYGTTSGQVSGLPPGSIDSVISSPLYAESVKGDHAETETASESRAKRKTAGGSLGQSARHGGDGAADGQVGALKEGDVDAVLTSPPFAASLSGKGRSPEKRPDGSPFGQGQSIDQADYGQTDGQIGALKEGQIEGVITSPPWEDQLNNHDKTWVPPKATPGVYQADYGISAGQIGRESGESYWQAMSVIYRQVYDALRPGGVCAVVIKDYVSKKKRVPLCDQTAQLLSHVGLVPFLRVRTMLVKETTQADLYGGTITERTERKSFFRRLAEKKGSPRIDWEEVIFCRKPDMFAHVAEDK